MVKLKTERLIIRNYMQSDLRNFHRLMSDKKNMYYLDDIVADSLEESTNQLNYSIANADGHYFCLIDKQTDAYIGSVGYTITDETPLGKIVHMGYFILNIGWKNSEAKKFEKRQKKIALLKKMTLTYSLT